MKTFSIFILSSAFICCSALAQNMSVDANQLGDLSLQTKAVEPVSTYTGKNIMATVAILPGQSYVFKSPINVQQIQYIKGVGSKVKKNQAFALIQGPEVHHFYMAYQMKKKLFSQAQMLFENSRKLYQRKSISEQAWLDISNQYHDTKMEFDELTHFFDLVLSFDENTDSLTLAAPIAGIIQYSLPSALDAQQTIASFAPLQAIRLKVNLPIDITQKPLFVSRDSSIGSDSCQLAIDFSESANAAFYQIAWTKALTNDCAFVVGQILSVTPEYQTSAYKIKQSSVFNWEGDNYIFVQDTQNYVALKVTLVTSDGDNFIVKSPASLANKRVLISSVSAVQGVLLGLGI
ncbi:hypothetical protein [Brumicola pallidula]|jgi:hypothetical protein|uniref:RND efflux pump membrane fusion protein barrel-sandwich domain-containing protein n=1 Tax=Brumicola pallidula DSM 14239 = ACAM 615 TaxID=1121922 RepID=K6YTX3_9ALTE|nr:hypothetical protein [Glaciecola pallidula]GAC27391.1 hypothetical protein GPAL_0511 [Glaciecola pallidula DSM 14239 = ACAM 615]